MKRMYPIDAPLPKALDVEVSAALKAHPLHAAPISKIAISNDGRMFAR